jgi:hypothetical protein
MAAGVRCFTQSASFDHEDNRFGFATSTYLNVLTDNGPPARSAKVAATTAPASQNGAPAPSAW